MPIRTHDQPMVNVLTTLLWSIIVVVLHQILLVSTCTAQGGLHLVDLLVGTLADEWKALRHCKVKVHQLSLCLNSSARPVSLANWCKTRQLLLPSCRWRWMLGPKVLYEGWRELYWWGMRLFWRWSQPYKYSAYLHEQRRWCGRTADCNGFGIRPGEFDVFSRTSPAVNHINPTRLCYQRCISHEVWFYFHEHIFVS